jgi:hypothetical protein
VSLILNKPHLLKASVTTFRSMCFSATDVHTFVILSPSFAKRFIAALPE